MGSYLSTDISLILRTLPLQTSKKRRVRYKTSVLLWKTWVLGKHGFSVLLFSYQLSFGSLPNQIYSNLVHVMLVVEP